MVVLIAVAAVRHVALEPGERGPPCRPRAPCGRADRGPAPSGPPDPVLVDSVGDGTQRRRPPWRVTFMNRSGQAPPGSRGPRLDRGPSRPRRLPRPRPDGVPYPRAGCYVTEAIEHGGSRSARRTPTCASTAPCWPSRSPPPVPCRSTGRRPTGRGTTTVARSWLPRRHRTPRDGAHQGGVPLGGQPRAPHHRSPRSAAASGCCPVARSASCRAARPRSPDSPRKSSQRLARMINGHARPRSLAPARSSSSSRRSPATSWSPPSVAELSGCRGCTASASDRGRRGRRGRRRRPVRAGDDQPDRQRHEVLGPRRPRRRRGASPARARRDPLRGPRHRARPSPPPSSTGSHRAVHPGRLLRQPPEGRTGWAWPSAASWWRGWGSHLGRERGRPGHQLLLHPPCRPHLHHCRVRCRVPRTSSTSPTPSTTPSTTSPTPDSTTRS